MNYQAPKDLLANKTILVTGAGAGIGRQAALSYAEHGATVILLGKTVAKLEAVYDEIVEAGFPEPAIIPLDMNGATAQNYKDMAQTIEDQFGCLDGLLLNAAALGTLSPFEHISEKSFKEVMNVNVTAHFLMVQALLPVLKKSPAASVLFTSSGVVIRAKAYWGAYAASKWATDGMMQTLSDEYEKSTIRFNSINPGPTKTPMRNRAYPGEDKDLIAKPIDLMPTYLYMMGNDSAEVNGQTVQAQDEGVYQNYLKN